MKVYCRCSKCNSLLTVEYNGKAFVCSACGETVLTENDNRITEDYICEKNGNLNVIGDEIDTMMSEMNPTDLDELIGNLMELEEEMHTSEIAEQAVALSEAKVHDCVKYGDYFWIVIGIKDDCKLLLSKECMNYDINFKYGNNAAYVFENNVNYQWEASQYRSYLNTYFLDNFFSEDEKRDIVPHRICVKEQGSTHFIEDRVFLLSKKEVMDYLPIPEDRIATMHVMYNDVKREWFLRIDDNSVKQPDVIDKDGNFTILPDGYVVEWFRPAILVK